MQRLHVYLSRSGVASRRKSEKLIKAGRITVNGVKVITFGTKVKIKDEVRFDGNLVLINKGKEYFALNKPKGYLCANADPQKRPLAINLISKAKTRIFHVGRLDFISCGLIFFTNDGYFSMQVSHPRYQVEKEYLVKTYDKVAISFLEKFRIGCLINNVNYSLKDYEKVSEKTVKIILTEGQNREIRNVFSDGGIRIKSLTRIRIGSVTLGSLGAGNYRSLTLNEVNSFF